MSSQEREALEGLARWIDCDLDLSDLNVERAAPGELVSCTRTKECWERGDVVIKAARTALARMPKLTHGRHCSCSACAAEDWTRPELACCGMHGPTCAAVYAPLNSFGIPETLPHETSEDE